MKVLITGGAGFIGSHLADYYQGRVRILDDFSAGRQRNIEGVEFVEASVLDREAIRGAVQGVDIVVHLAALISVPESLQFPERYDKVNAQGTKLVLEEAAAAGVEKLVFASSAAIYGDAGEVPLTEASIPAPQSPYARTKLEGEEYCASFDRSGRLRTACLRFFNVFGPRQNPASAYAAAVPAFLRKAIRGEPITIFGDGEQTRDFIYVKDIVAGLAFAAANPEVRGIFNCGYGRETSINDLVARIVREAGSSSSIVHGPARAGDVRRSCADVRKLRETGWLPQSTLEEGLRETLKSLRQGEPAGSSC